MKARAKVRAKAKEEQMAKLTEVESVRQTDKNIEVVVKQVDSRRPGILRKHIAEWMEGDKKQVVFLSLKKEAMFFITENEYVQFKNNIFRTNVDKCIEYLRDHPAYNIELFENDFPQHIKQKFENDKKYITRDPEEYE